MPTAKKGKVSKQINDNIQHRLWRVAHNYTHIQVPFCTLLKPNSKRGLDVSETQTLWTCIFNLWLDTNIVFVSHCFNLKLFFSLSLDFNHRSPFCLYWSRKLKLHLFHICYPMTDLYHQIFPHIPWIKLMLWLWRKPNQHSLNFFFSIFISSCFVHTEKCRTSLCITASN